MSDLESRVVEAAVAWECARQEALRLKQERAECICENEAKAEPSVGYWGATPCWRTYQQTAPDDVEPLPRSQWCAPCVRRQAIHEQYRAAMQARGATMRSLHRRITILRAARPGGMPAQEVK